MSGERRFWIRWYNRPRQFDNGIVWFRVNVRLRSWHQLGGLWFSRSLPFFKVLLPQADGPRKPIQMRGIR